MGDIKGFLKVKRKALEYRPVCERLKDYREIIRLHSDEDYQQQASRCMDCGTPFCHWGCPVGNFIPEWNDFMFSGHWEKALKLLCATNNLPEITGRLCPAFCEYACVLGINDDPVTIKDNELSIIEYGFKTGLIKPLPPKKRSAKKIAVVGSGPAGLSCADQLNKAGHKVVVFERDDKIGGILRYGIPDFKLEKWIIDRRVELLKKEGIEFATLVNVGLDYSVVKLKKKFDAICLAGGCRVSRDLKIPGRELKGIHFAMEYLIQSNRRVAGEKISINPERAKPLDCARDGSRGGEPVEPRVEWIDAKDKKVVVIGGGDTGADCVGTAHRQGAACVVQIEILPKPAECRTQDFSWPKYPMLLKTSTSHEEGGERKWQILTNKFLGKNGRVSKLSCMKADFSQKDERGCPVIREVPGEEIEIEADLVILALGFIHPEYEGLLSELNLKLDPRGNIKTDLNFMSSAKGIFSCGDMRQGQSVIVRAIAEGRCAAHYIDKYLMGKSCLPLI